MNKPHPNLTIGTILHLQPVNQGAEYSFDVTLIGYTPGESLVVSHPLNNDAAIQLVAGAPYHATISSGDSIYAFETEILRVCEQPYQYMHLHFPAGIQGVTLRRAQRLSIEEPSLTLSIQDGAGPFGVTMQDISPLGARLIAEQPLGAIDDFFCIDVLHKSTTDPISFPCTIRHIKHVARPGKKPVYHYGVEFSNLEASALSFITHFIRDNVTNQRAPSA
ncbi:hypothetical protein MNBD_GAMMA26-2188 [hydrothermal vent metagenome]|uniref:PilZ domain-containing protein n=1 Tax=hydrothermal vent metagenome TaxID=652676 RepID=A0A3B1BAD7_9ZZZZ